MDVLDKPVKLCNAFCALTFFALSQLDPGGSKSTKTIFIFWITFSKCWKSFLLVAGRERNLILCELPELNTQDQRVLSQPLRVTFGAISIPHPEKVSKDKAKAVNKQSEGWGGEDAYFCAAGRWNPIFMFTIRYLFKTVRIYFKLSVLRCWNHRITCADQRHKSPLNYTRVLECTEKSWWSTSPWQHQILLSCHHYPDRCIETLWETITVYSRPLLARDAIHFALYIKSQFC